MATTLLVTIELGLHLIALGGLAHISLLIHAGNLAEAVFTAVIAAFCILVVASAISIAKYWLSD